MQLFSSKALFICLLLSMQPIFSQTDNSPIELNTPSQTSDLASGTILLVDSIINFSKQYLGSPYRGGGKGPTSFDCSGFTSFVFNNFGIKLGGSSGDQAEQLPTISKNDIQPGDLVFYNGRRRGTRVGHVGLVISKHENGEFDFIHSASSVGISVSNSESDYYNRRYVKAGRVFAFDSLIARTNNTNSEYSSQIAYSSLAPEKNAPNEQNAQTIRVQKTIPAKYHTVKSGETLSSIANKYGLTVAQLKKKNHLKTDLLSLKQRLKIKDEQEIAVVEKQKPFIEHSVKADSMQANNVITETNSPEMQSTYHIVKKGETLYSISKIYGITFAAFKELNQLTTDKITVGQKLTIPLKGASSNKTSIAKPKTKMHTVKSGETLSEIAEKYHCTVRELKTWNNKNNNKLSLGEKLRIVY